MKTIEDTKLFHTIREPLETIPEDGTKIISGDIITFWDKDEATHSVKIDGAPKYSSGLLDDSTKVFSKNGAEKFDPRTSVEWRLVKEKYDGGKNCKFAVYRHVENARPWSNTGSYSQRCGCNIL